MLATFVIGLREGLEASLIVAIVTAFLRRHGRVDLIRWVLAGVALAVALCAAVGVTLRVVSHELPQRQQEGLETVVGLVAVCIVTYMVVWMRRNSRHLKTQLESAASGALATGSAWALVAMAFVAVLREGFETAVFLLAALNETQDGGFALTGAVLGVAVAVGLGVGIYRGGVRINLSKFFRATGAVLVLVAAGLLASAAHTAHEAGWLDAGQQQVLDLSRVVGPGTVQGALVTGMLGIQPRPVLAELLVWLAYLVLLTPYVVWPPGRSVDRHRASRVSAVTGALAALAAAALVTAAPAAAATGPTSRLDGVGARLDPAVPSPSTARLQVSVPAGAGDATGGLALPAGDYAVQRAGSTTLSGVRAAVYTATRQLPGGGAHALSRDQVVARNGGRLPLGTPVGDQPISVTDAARQTLTAWVEPVTGRVLALRTDTRTTTTAQLPGGPVVLGGVQESIGRTSASAAAAQTSRARSDLRATHDHRLMRGLAAAALAAGLCLLLAAAMLRRTPARPDTPAAAPRVRQLA